VAEFEQSIVINAPAEDVFNFVSNLNNLPKYLPSLQHAQSSGPDRLRVQGASDGQGIDAPGFFRVDPAEYFMEWSAETEHNYSGWLEIQELDDTCEITAHISFRPSPNSAAQMRQDGHTDEAIESELRSALMSIKELCERAQMPSGW
jgi:uncharacterized membrane protein